MTVVNLIDLAAAAVISTVVASRPIRELSTMSNLQDQKKTRTKDDGSVVTDADFAAQGIIVRCLRQVPGDYRIVGEESQEEMEQHLHAELTDEATERKRLFRLAQLELHNRYHRVTMTVPPLSSKSDVDIESEIASTYDKTEESEASQSGYLVESSRVSVFIDPLDGTKSYAKGDYETVSILVAIILDNIPYFGVITKPFDYREHGTILDTGCVSVYGGNLLRGAFLAGGTECKVIKKDGLPRAVISSSRSEGIVSDFVKFLAGEGVIDPNPVHVSGAGEKSLRLVLGTENETLWFFPRPGTARWDVAASDAILRPLGGSVTDKFGNPLDYSIPRDKAENVDGIIACNDAALLTECIRLLKEDKWNED